MDRSVPHADRTWLRRNGRPPNLASANKLFVRERIDLLFDDCTSSRMASLPHAMAADLPPTESLPAAGSSRDGRSRGEPTIPSVKAGPGGPDVEKIIRMTEVACVTSCRSSGSSTRQCARITDQVDPVSPVAEARGGFFRNLGRTVRKGAPDLLPASVPSAAGARTSVLLRLVIMVGRMPQCISAQPRMA
jgi:hypothetical protein